MIFSFLKLNEMKTKILIIVVIILSVSYTPVMGQNSSPTTNDKNPDSGLDVAVDPKFTQADIDMLVEAVKGAPVNAQPVKDDRLPSEEQMPEGVYTLAPANAEPIDYEAEQQREREQVSISPDEGKKETSEPIDISQEIPEKKVEVTNYRNISGPMEQPDGIQPTVPNTGYPKGSSEQPPGEKAPD
jgi:hypothetical protein